MTEMNRTQSVVQESAVLVGVLLARAAAAGRSAGRIGRPGRNGRCPGGRHESPSAAKAPT